jgi:hypothetical protein
MGYEIVNELIKKEGPTASNGRSSLESLEDVQGLKHIPEAREFLEPKNDEKIMLVFEELDEDYPDLYVDEVSMWSVAMTILRERGYDFDTETRKWTRNEEE